MDEARRFVEAGGATTGDVQELAKLMTELRLAPNASLHVEAEHANRANMGV